MKQSTLGGFPQPMRIGMEQSMPLTTKGSKIMSAMTKQEKKPRRHKVRYPQPDKKN